MLSVAMLSVAMLSVAINTVSWYYAKFCGIAMTVVNYDHIFLLNWCQKPLKKHRFEKYIVATHMY
jgi:hypothetical protein